MRLKNDALQVFFQLIRKDLLAFWRDYPSKLLDTAICFATNVIVFAYFMPQEGIREGYGLFFLIGVISSFGLIEVVGKVGAFVADIYGEKTISSTLVMPIRSEGVFCYIAIFWALTSALLAIMLFPLGKFLLFHEFDLSSISYTRLVVMFTSSNLFYGIFGLWVASLLNDIGSLNRLWLRYVVPIWMFGGYFYSWKSSMLLNPIIGCVSLINPMIYIMEGMRAAVIGQEGYLPYWVCLIMVWVFNIVLLKHAVFRLKRKLDCV